MAERWIEAVKRLYEYFVNETIVQDLFEPSSDKEMLSYFLDKGEEDFESETLASFIKLADGLHQTIDYPVSIYPYVDKIKGDIKLIAGENLGSISKTELVEIAKFNAAATLFLCSISIATGFEGYEKIKQAFTVHDTIYFRGQTSASYGLLPSLYRGLEVEGDIITLETIEKKYKQHGFYQRYSQIFPRNGKSKVDYDMMSYVQHSASYSPLLDVTSSFDAALFFACSGKNINPNLYETTDAALFAIQLLKGESTKTDLNIKWIKGKARFDSCIVDDLPLYACSHEDFYVYYTMADKVTNDRMRYQRGGFLYIEEAAAINGHFLIPFDQINIIKITIPAAMKKELYQKAMASSPHLSEEYIYDPYAYLSNYAGGEGD